KTAVPRIPVNQSLMRTASITPVKAPSVNIDSVDWNHDNYPQRIKSTNQSAYPAIGSSVQALAGELLAAVRVMEVPASILAMDIFFGCAVMDGSPFVDQSRAERLIVCVSKPVGRDLMAFLSWTCTHRSQLDWLPKGVSNLRSALLLFLKDDCIPFVARGGKKAHLRDVVQRLVKGSTNIYPTYSDVLGRSKRATSCKCPDLQPYRCANNAFLLTKA
ncbi:unnamed protein product, partial [Fusarium graminearum]